MIKNYSDFKNTYNAWQPYSGKILNQNDAYEITDNITSFFSLLLEIDNKKKGGENNKTIRDEKRKL